MKKNVKAVELCLAAVLAVGAVSCGGAQTGGDAGADAEASPAAEAEASPAAEAAAEGGEESAEPTEGEKANAEFEDKLEGEALLAALKEGGHVIYFRHAQTEKDYADQASENLDVNDCSTQRTLSEAGWEDATAIGAAFTEKEIPVDQVVSSEYCRSWQTAKIAFGRYDKKDSKLNFLPFEDYTDEQVEEMKSNVMPLLTAKPADGKNTVIVGLDDIFESATGIYPDPQGMAYILTPDGEGGFELVANMEPGDWGNL
ncbi:MAG: histidine phosphatase family protein [Cyanophyceae cyanobacterium]